MTLCGGYRLNRIWPKPSPIRGSSTASATARLKIAVASGSYHHVFTAGPCKQAEKSCCLLWSDHRRHDDGGSTGRQDSDQRPIMGARLAEMLYRKAGSQKLPIRCASTARASATSAPPCGSDAVIAKLKATSSQPESHRLKTVSAAPTVGHQHARETPICQPARRVPSRSPPIAAAQRGLT